MSKQHTLQIALHEKLVRLAARCGVARVALPLALAAVVMAGGCRPSAPPASTLIYGRGSDADSLDPIDTSSGETVKVLVNLYDTLVTYDETSLDLVPSLAESWESSDDGLVWTFHLREGVKFHDGTSLGAAAVVFTFERILQEDHPHLYGAMRPYQLHYANILEVREIDPLTVEFRLHEPSAVFLENLAMFSAGIVSPTAVKGYGASFKEHPVGTGPFMLESWRRSEELVLKAFADHWQGPPGVDRVVFLIVPENSIRAELLRRGQIHIADNLPPDTLDALAQQPGVRVQRQMGLNVGYLSIQLEKPPLDNLKLREALAYAIDKQGLIEAAYSGHAVPAVSMVAPTIFGHHEGLVDRPYDPDRARTLLAAAAAEAGFTLPLKLRLYVMDQPRPYVQQPDQTAVFIKDCLTRVGIEIKIVKGDVPKYFQTLSRGEHELGLIGWSCEKNDADDVLGSLLVSSAISDAGGNNNSRYANPHFDELIEQARHEVDPDRRQQLYQEAQELVLADVPVIPLVHSYVGIAQRDELKGYDLHPLSIVRLRLAHFEEQAE